jgi:hypothetical protein
MSDVGKYENKGEQPSPMSLLKTSINELKTDITILGGHIAKLSNGIIEVKPVDSKEESECNSPNNVLDSMRIDIKFLNERIGDQINNIKELQKILL